MVLFVTLCNNCRPYPVYADSSTLPAQAEVSRYGIRHIIGEPPARHLCTCFPIIIAFFWSSRSLWLFLYLYMCVWGGREGGIWRILGDSWRFLRCHFEFLGIFCHSSGILKDSLGILRDSMTFFGDSVEIPRDAGGFWGILGDSGGFWDLNWSGDLTERFLLLMKASRRGE